MISAATLRLAGSPILPLLPVGESMIDIRLMGRLDVRASDGRPMAITSRRSVALLACLGAGDGEAWSRERLAALLWAGRGVEQARASLRQELFRLRQMLGGLRVDALASGREVLLPADQFTVDVVRFRAACAEPQGYRQAIELFRGPLLQDVVPDAGPFGQWLQRQRRSLQEQMGDCLRRAVKERVAAGDRAEARELARRLLWLDASRDKGRPPLLTEQEKRELSELLQRPLAAP